MPIPRSLSWAARFFGIPGEDAKLIGLNMEHLKRIEEPFLVGRITGCQFFRLLGLLIVFRRWTSFVVLIAGLPSSALGIVDPMENGKIRFHYLLVYSDWNPAEFSVVPWVY